MEKNYVGKAKITTKVKITGDHWDYIDEEYDEADYVIKEMLKETDALFGQINWDSRYLEIDIIDIKGRKILLQQNGEWDMYGGPYSPKFKTPTLEIDGENYTSELREFLEETGEEECFEAGWDINFMFQQRSDILGTWESFMKYTFPN